MSKENKDAFYKIANDKFQHAKIFETRMNDSRFELDFLPII